MRNRIRALALATVALTGCDRLALENPLGPPASGGGGPPPPVLPSAHGSVGLVAACGGVARLRADWSVPADGLDGIEGAVFAGTDSAALFTGTAHPVDLARGHVILEGVPDGVELHVGLGLRAVAAMPDSAIAAGTGEWVQSGPVLRVHTGPPVYVNPALAPDAGDGTSPETAFGDLALGMLIANSQGGGSVWVSEGTVQNAAIPLFEGVHLVGGFGADFVLGRRDPVEAQTLLVGVPGQAITTVTSGPGGTAVIDGIAFTGTAAVPAALDDTGRRVEMRSLRIFGCQRGIKLRNISTSPVVAVVLAGVEASGAQLEGLSIDGPFDLWLEACAFDANGNEGLDLNHLWAPSGATSRLVVRGSSFRSNGNEGVDCHLGASPGPTSPGGFFDVRIQDCDFEGNGLDGLRVDVDYESTPAWSADVLVRGSRARANRGAGVHLDLDGRTRTLLHGIVASANGQDGVLVTSETFAGMATVASSALLGNLGAGLRASLGNVSIAASHCVLAGNSAGDAQSAIVPVVAHSCASYLAGAASGGIQTHACVVASDPLALAFLRAPIGFATATGLSAGLVVLDAASSASIGDDFEIADDGASREVTSTTGTSIGLEPVPDPFSVPARCSWFAPGTDVREDWRLGRGSIAVGAGLVPPGAEPVDAGIFGAPLALAPGRDAALPPELFAAVETMPAWSRPIGASTTFTVAFVGGEPDPASVAASVLAFRSTGAPLGIVPGIVGGKLEVPAPAGGWRTGDRIEIHRGLAATDGRPLCAPLVAPLLVP
ncbi:MAG: right-handed parallel beta-helix repeat-containing protein [Planctomycetota bacterium]|nr:right-handed parallel beta-helix repeat-containing protein [Planctomycetota bacterium]